MTPPYIIPNESSTETYNVPGYGLGEAFAAAGAGLGRLGASIGDVMNPNADFQRKIKDYLATNPEGLQNLIDFSKQNPESFWIMAQRFPKSVKAAIMQGQPSAGAETRTAVSPQRRSELLNMKTSELAQMDLTPAELAVVKGATGAEPGVSAGIQQRGELAVRTRQYFHGLPADLQADVAGYELDYIKHLTDLADAERMRLSLRRETQTDKVNDWRERYRAMTVEMALRKYGVGTPELWDQYYSDPKIQQRSQDLARGVTPPLNDTDAQLMQMGQAVVAEPDRRKALGRFQTMRTINTIMGRITGGRNAPADDEQKITTFDVPLLQQQLDILSSPTYGGPRLHANYETTTKGINLPTGRVNLPGFLQHKELTITDELGNVVDPTVLNQIPVNPSTVNPHAVSAMLGSNPRAAEAWNRIVQSGNIGSSLTALRDAEVAQKIPLQNGLWWAITQALQRLAPTDIQEPSDSTP